MIVNEDDRDTQTINLLTNSKFKVYLGGSRRMQQLMKKFNIELKMDLKSKTDYDFYATYSNEIKKFLITNGFVESSLLEDDSNYDLDEETEMILENGNIQVSLKTDAEFYKSVFENIDPRFYYFYLWKSKPVDEWDEERTTFAYPQISNFFNMLYKIGRATKKQ